MEFSELDIAMSSASSTKTLTQVKERGAAKMLQGSVGDMVADLVNQLKEEDKVL